MNSLSFAIASVPMFHEITMDECLDTSSTRLIQ